MGQEAEPEINFVCLRAIVDEAIRNMETSAIEAMDSEKQEKELRYMQKYAELLKSKDESRISFESYFIGRDSIGFAIIAIGLSYLLVGVSKYPMLETISVYVGVIIIILGANLLLRKIKEFKKTDKDIEFMRTIILKIEEKLPIRT